MRFSALGDRIVLITLGDTIDEGTHRRVRAVCARLDARPVPGVVEYVPAFASVAVHYDPARLAGGAATPFDAAARALAAALADAGDEADPGARMVEIPVCYGGDLGPDLDDVARHAGLDADAVVRAHAAGEYLVYMVGFAPGFAYLGGLDPRLATPRRSAPRTAVPASAVGIGGSQTGVYPIVSPGGWNLIGRTPLRVFDLDRTPPTLMRAGDRVRFRAISREEFDRVTRGPGA